MIKLSELEVKMFSLLIKEAAVTPTIVYHMASVLELDDMVLRSELHKTHDKLEQQSAQLLSDEIEAQKEVELGAELAKHKFNLMLLEMQVEKALEDAQKEEAYAKEISRHEVNMKMIKMQAAKARKEE